MKHLNAVVATLGVALLSSAAFTVQAASNPFAAQELSSGYSLAAGEKAGEGSCGEGKCGAEVKAEGQGQATDAAKPAAKPQAKSEAKAEAEGKCGEGKCGADKQDA